MRTRYQVRTPDAAHFITATIVEWLPVFTSTACCDILVRSLIHCRAHAGLKIQGWVILNTHFHAILAGPDLAQTIGNLKKFTAREILAQVRAEERDWLLNQLAYYCVAHKTRSQHQVWREGSHPQAIVTDDMMRQKLEYLHKANSPSHAFQYIQTSCTCQDICRACCLNGSEPAIVSAIGRDKTR